jgi:hypothetical protein
MSRGDVGKSVIQNNRFLTVTKALMGDKVVPVLN